MKKNQLVQLIYILVLMFTINVCFASMLSNVSQQTPFKIENYTDSIKINDTTFVYDWYKDSTLCFSDSTYKIGSKMYQITCKAYSLNDTIYKSINHIDSNNRWNVHVWIEKTSNIIYDFKVKENGKLLFSKSISKIDFNDLNDQIINQSCVSNPVFIGCGNSD